MSKPRTATFLDLERLLGFRRSLHVSRSVAWRHRRDAAILHELFPRSPGALSLNSKVSLWIAELLGPRGLEPQPKITSDPAPSGGRLGRAAWINRVRTRNQEIKAMGEHTRLRMPAGRGTTLFFGHVRDDPLGNGNGGARDKPENVNSQGQKLVIAAKTTME